MGQTAITPDKRTTILALVTTYAPEIAKLAPRGVDPEHYTASLRLYLGSYPKLLDCAPASIVKGMLRIAQTGLELGVSCDLLPFGNQCQFNPRYNGIVELALHSGVRAINVGIVREGDEFVCVKGTSPVLRHVANSRESAPITHAYAIAEIKQGAYAFETMTREEIDSLRKQFSKSWWADKKGNVIPLEEISWYGKKTVLRRLSPMLPKNARFAAALLFEREVEEMPADAPPPVTASAKMVEQLPVEDTDEEQRAFEARLAAEDAAL